MADANDPNAKPDLNIEKEIKEAGNFIVFDDGMIIQNHVENVNLHVAEVRFQKSAYFEELSKKEIAALNKNKISFPKSSYSQMLSNLNELYSKCDDMIKVRTNHKHKNRINKKGKRNKLKTDKTDKSDKNKAVKTEK